MNNDPVTQGFLTDAVWYWGKPCDEPSSLLLFHGEFTDSCFTFMSDSACFEWSRVAQWLALLIGFGLCFPTYVSSDRHLLTCRSTSHIRDTLENSSVHFSVCVSKGVCYLNMLRKLETSQLVKMVLSAIHGFSSQPLGRLMSRDWKCSS